MSVNVEVEEGFIPFNFANSNACPRNEQIAPSVKLSIILDLEKKTRYCVLFGITTEVKFVAVAILSLNKDCYRSNCKVRT